jgi:hypothetical protein
MAGVCQLTVLFEVLLVCCDADRHRVGPADQLEPGRDLAVIEIGIVAAIAADELKVVAVAALRTAAHDADGLAAQNHRPAVLALIAGRHAFLLGDGSASGAEVTARKPSVIV